MSDDLGQKNPDFGTSNRSPRLRGETCWALLQVSIDLAVRRLVL